MQFDNDLGFGRKALPTDIAHNIGVFDTITASQVKNVTIDDPSNTIAASGLVTATGAVTVSNSTPPVAGQVLTALSATAAAWTNASAQTFWEEQTAGTNGGSFTAGSWVTRTLNMTGGNLNGTSLSSNQMTLPAGRYVVFAQAPAYQCDINQLRLQNITDGTTQVIGQVSHSAFIGFGGIVDASLIALLSGFFIIEESKTFELQHQCQTTASPLTVSGLGFAGGFGPEIYAVVSFISVS